MEDRRTGTGKPVVSTGQEATVVNGLFAEILRRTPTADELTFYTRRLNMSGVNGVVAGLYNSQEFRAQAVDNYYLELLGRAPTQQEVTQGVVRLTFGTEPAYAARIAGTQEFYTASATGGGKYGTQPSANTYVNLLYRTMLGQATNPVNGAILVQQLQGGEPTGRVANQFVNSDPYRTVKVGEVYQVLGQEPTPADIAGYVSGWLRAGGQAGISMSLLATAGNIQRIEAGLVPVPDVQAAAVLRQLLLAPYIDGPTGFYQQYQTLVGNCSDTQSPSCKNPAVFNLLKQGMQRGIPNSALQPIGITSTVTTLVPTQNEIDMTKSLYYPLIDPSTLGSYFAGGTVNPFGGPIVSANNGTYIVDGHHRWSSIYLINPYAQLSAVDLGYVPNPQTALRQAELGVAATNGKIEGSTAGEQNLYTISQAAFNAYVATTITTGDPNPELTDAQRAAKIVKVFDTFQKNLKYPVGTPPTPENPNPNYYTDQIPYIQDYLWGNVLRMRDKNAYVPGAPSRAVMPQLDPFLPVLNTLDSGSLSYSFPTISYLG